MLALVPSSSQSPGLKKIEASESHPDDKKRESEVQIKFA
jgi:hypothetical protein